MIPLYEICKVNEEFFIGAALSGIGPNRTHIGIVYKWRGIPFFLHMAWDRNLKKEVACCAMYQPGVPYLATFLEGLPDEMRFQISNLLNRIYKRHKSGTLRYGFNWRGGVFRSDGEWEPESDNELGLTCSTFVLASLKSYKIEFFDISSLTYRAEDGAWKEQMLDLMKSTSVDQEHITAVTENQLNFRIKPEEVFAAFLLDERPCEFTTCAQVGKDLVLNLPLGSSVQHPCIGRNR